MAANPLIAQGQLNKLRASLVFPDHPELNVTGSFLGVGGISMALEGQATRLLPTMTGTVPSPEPYMLGSIRVNLIRSQSLANAYKAQLELNSILGNATVYPDAISLGTYSFFNEAIQSVDNLIFNGTDAGWIIVLQGYYPINSDMYNL